MAGSAVPGGKQGESEGNDREGRERDGPLLPVQLQPQRSGWQGKRGVFRIVVSVQYVPTYTSG